MDTGTTVTTITPSVLEEAPELKKLVAKSSVSHVTGISGRSLQLVGKIKLAVQLGGVVSLPHRIVVMEDTADTFQFILGLAILKSYEFVLSTVDRCFKVVSSEGTTVEVPLRVVHAEGVVCRVTSHTRVIVPPRTRQFITASVGDGAEGMEGCVEPLFPEKSSILMARSLNKITNGVMFVEVTNWTSKEIAVEKSHRVGTFEAILDGVCVLNVDGAQTRSQSSILTLNMNS